MLVYGRNVANEIFNYNPKIINKIYLQDGFDDINIINNIEKYNIFVKKLQKNDMNTLANGVHQGIIIDISNYKYEDLKEINPNSQFVVMLDHIEDPHNLGAIIRTCEASGVDYIIIPKDRSASINATVFKTSAGAVLRSHIVLVSNLSNAIKYLKNLGFWIYSSAMDGEDYSKIDYDSKTCLIIGNEGKGVSPIVRKASDFIISIPMKGNINSLNASVAAGILIYGVIRNRK